MDNKAIRYEPGMRVIVVAQDCDEDDGATAKIGDVGTVIGHEDSDECVNIQFEGFIDWLWNNEVTIYRAI